MLESKSKCLSPVAFSENSDGVMRTPMGTPTDTLREYSTHKFTVKITDLNNFFIHEHNGNSSWGRRKKPYICIFAYRHWGIAFNAFIFLVNIEAVFLKMAQQKLGWISGGCHCDLNPEVSRPPTHASLVLLPSSSQLSERCEYLS